MTLQAKEGYLQGQIGNPDGEEKPNKKFYDPRVWIRKASERGRVACGTGMILYCCCRILVLVVLCNVKSGSHLLCIVSRLPCVVLFSGVVVQMGCVGRGPVVHSCFVLVLHIVESMTRERSMARARVCERMKRHRLAGNNP